MARYEKARKSYNPETGDVRFEFANGEALAINVRSDIPDTLREQVLAHGLLQKGGDSYAGAETVEEAYESAKATLDAIRAGEWASAREGVGAGGGDLIKALVRVRGCTEEAARAVVMALDADKRKAVRKIPAVAKVLLEIAAERALARAESAEAGSADDLAALGL